MFNVYYYKWQWIDDESDFEIFDILAFFGISLFLGRWITRWRWLGFWLSSPWRSSTWWSRRCSTWSKTLSRFLMLFELNKMSFWIYTLTKLKNNIKTAYIITCLRRRECSFWRDSICLDARLSFTFSRAWSSFSTRIFQLLTIESIQSCSCFVLWALSI